MAAAKKLWPLNKGTDGAHWDTEDLFGRLCIVADAAFLSWLPAVRRARDDALLAHREDTDAAVLCISRRGRRRGCCGGGKIAVDAYVDCNGRQRNARRERLPLAALAPVISGGMDDAARALTTSSSSSSPDDANGGAPWLWKLFADQLCRRLFLSICLHSGVPVLPSFACLPVDLQMTILCRLHVAEDVARVECASKELRRLVADHDAVLWKAKYESIRSLNSRLEQPVEFRPPPILTTKEPLYFTDEDMALMSWKERYAMTRWQTMVMSTWRFRTTPMPTWKPRVPPAKRARLQTIIDMVRRRAQHNSPQHHDRPDQPRTVAQTKFWKQVPPNEPYRVILGDVRDKLYNTRERSRHLLSSRISEIPEEATFTNVEQFRATLLSPSLTMHCDFCFVLLLSGSDESSFH
ncbi:unnamed protein product [Miscanthus lutarioriparius]|uniref:F-box domain-containing protein n=1 Tax=Miscanthus lutarioriparius TaxID=422564 RepID=A0A811MXR6_9POAL|nr:unnamed protein product [Miscanthus lutarioriparius]